MCLNEIATCVSAVAAAVGIGITCWQTWVGNKQALFERRLNLWTEVVQLSQIYDKFCDLLEDDEALLAADLFLSFFTNTATLHKLPDVLTTEDPNAKIVFLTALEAMRTDAQQASLVFRGESAEVIGDFLACYASLLDELYRYGLLVNIMKKQQDIDPCESLERAYDKFGEGTYRKALMESKSNLARARAALKKLQDEEIVQRQIRL